MKNLQIRKSIYKDININKYTNLLLFNYDKKYSFIDVILVVLLKFQILNFILNFLNCFKFLNFYLKFLLLNINY